MLKIFTYTLHLDSFRRRSGSWIFPDAAVRSTEIGSSVLAAPAIALMSNESEELSAAEIRGGGDES